MSDPEPIEARVAGDGRSVDLTCSDGLRESLPAVWLCDNAQDAFDGQTGQRRLGLARRRPDPVRPPPPSPRLLHAIRADAEGGAICFADGFAHARALEEAAPEAFERLSLASRWNSPSARPTAPSIARAGH